MLGALGPTNAARVVQAMDTIERLLGAPEPAAATLRSPRPGDIGWVVQSHGALYAAEYGFDASFEALVAQVAAKFLASFDGSRERCWIAEIDGAPVGSVFLVRQSDDVAKLRMLLVDIASACAERPGRALIRATILNDYAFPRRRCSSRRGMISTKLHGLLR